MVVAGEDSDSGDAEEKDDSNNEEEEDGDVGLLVMRVMTVMVTMKVADRSCREIKGSQAGHSTLYHSSGDFCILAF